MGEKPGWPSAAPHQAPSPSLSSKVRVSAFTHTPPLLRTPPPAKFPLVTYSAWTPLPLRRAAGGGREEEEGEAGCWREVEGCSFWHQRSSPPATPRRTHVCCGAERRVQALAVHAPIRPTESSPAGGMGGVQHSALLWASLHVHKDLQKNPQPSLQRISYICFLITASLRLLEGGRGEEELGCREALHPQPKAHPAGRAAPLPHQMTRPDLAAQQVQLSGLGWFAVLCKKGHSSPTYKHRHTQRTAIRGHFYTFRFALQPSVTGTLGFPCFHTEPICQAAVHHHCVRLILAGVL